MQETEIKNIIEALLFAAREPLTQSQINNIFEPEIYNLEEIVVLLNKQYTLNGNSFVVNKIAGGYQIVSKEEYNHYISKLLKKSNKLKLSMAAMDSLAIIAYKQPISRYEIEAIRGVDSSGVLKTLLNHELIKIKGRDVGPGRALLYKTTIKFLEHFGLNRLADMPKLKEVSELIAANPSLGEQISVFEYENRSSKIQND